MAQKNRGTGVFWAAIVALALASGALWFVRPALPAAFSLHSWAVITFLVDLVCVAGLVGGISIAASGSLTGLAINPLNQYSLSRFQVAGWTIVVLAAVFTYGKLNLLEFFGHLATNATDGTQKSPLQFDIPGELLTAMGIATFTAAAVPGILELKKSQPEPGASVTDASKKRLSQMTSTPEAEIATHGLLMSRRNRNDAVWMDMVLGDEAANAGIIDMSKVQQLLVTVLLLALYIGEVVADLRDEHGSGLSTLPTLSATFVGLLALSHAGYLAYKAAPKAASDGDTTPGGQAGGGW